MRTASSSRPWTSGGSSTTTRPIAASTVFPSTNNSTSESVDPGPVIHWFEDIGLRDRAEVGGKGGSLGELTRAGIAVPPGFVIRTGAFEAFIDGLERESPVRARVEALRADDLAAISGCARALRARVLAAPLPASVAAELTTAHSALRDRAGHGDVAVRSSATTEDARDASFAGLQDT